MGEFSFEGCRFRHRWGFFREITSGVWKGYIGRVCRVCGIVQRRKPRLTKASDYTESRKSSGRGTT